MKNVYSVLIVEDDMLLSLVEGRLVEKLGYRVAGKAANGDVAVKKAKDLNPDVILMDISLKGETDGIQAMHKIREFSNAPVIYLSGNSDKISIERARKTNFIDYLIKPITESELAGPLKKATQWIETSTDNNSDYFSQAV